MPCYYPECTKAKICNGPDCATLQGPSGNFGKFLLIPYLGWSPQGCPSGSFIDLSPEADIPEEVKQIEAYADSEGYIRRHISLKENCRVVWVKKEFHDISDEEIIAIIKTGKIVKNNWISRLVSKIKKVF